MANELFQNAIKGVAQKTPPIWFMRQAGRYHSHYQALKEKHTFVELCKVPELAAETALGPIEEFDFDVSILFSDLLFPLEALGIGLKYAPGPILEQKLNASNVKNLKSVEEALPALEFQKFACQATRERLPKDKSFIGFVGGPWTLFTYAVEGSHKAAMTDVKQDMELFKVFCEKMTPLLIKNIEYQLEGGVETVMLLDTASGELSPWMFNEYIMPELNKIIAAYPGRLGYYGQKLTESHLPEIFNHPQLAGMGFDHRFQIEDRLKDRKRGFVQGNFDQTLLFSDESNLDKYLQQYIKPIKELSLEERAGWVCGVGHGILPKTPERNVHRFIEVMRKEFS